MTVINTNIKALVSQHSMQRNARELAVAMEQLSSGKRINRAKDDAAGLAISNRMGSQIRGLDQAVRNANDGIALLQTSEGALVEVTNMLQRMRELSVEAADDSYTDTDRASLDQEFAQLKSEISRIASNTQWNGMNVLNNEQDAGLAIGTGGLASDPASAGTQLRNLRFQVGANANQVISVPLKDFSISADPLAVPPEGSVFSGDAQLNDVSIASTTEAGVALERLDAALQRVSDERASFGAVINRLTYAGDNLDNVARNTQASRSRILDADYAKASSELSRTQIIQQAATAILAQANIDQQAVLKLLQG